MDVQEKFLELQAEYECFQKDKLEEIEELNDQVQKLTESLGQFEHFKDSDVLMRATEMEN